MNKGVHAIMILILAGLLGGQFAWADGDYKLLGFIFLAAACAWGWHWEYEKRRDLELDNKWRWERERARDLGQAYRRAHDPSL